MARFRLLGIYLILTTIFVFLCCSSKLQHQYAGKVVGPISVKTIPYGNSGSRLEYIFTYVDDVGTKHSSKNIERPNCGCDSKDDYKGFKVTKSKDFSWVEKKLINDNEVYIPGWRPLFTFFFVVYCIVYFVIAIMILYKIHDYATCRHSDNKEPSVYCLNDSCRKYCPFNPELKNKNSQYKKSIKKFFGY